MTRDDLIPLLEQADISQEVWFEHHRSIERFAALVAAEKEQQMIRDGWRKCAEGQRTTQFCGLLDAAVAEIERLREALHDISISQNSMYQESRAKQALGEDQKIWRMCGLNTDDVIKMAEEAGIVMSLTDDRVTLSKLNRFLELHLKVLKNEGYRRGET